MLDSSRGEVEHIHFMEEILKPKQKKLQGGGVPPGSTHPKPSNLNPKQCFKTVLA